MYEANLWGLRKGSVIKISDFMSQSVSARVCQSFFWKPQERISDYYASRRFPEFLMLLTYGYDSYFGLRDEVSMPCISFER